MGWKEGVSGRENGAVRCQRQEIGTPSCAWGAGKAGTYTVVMAAPGCGMRGACMARVGCPRSRKGSDTGHIALGKGPGWVCFRPVAMQRRGTIGEERGAGTVGQGSQEGGGEIGGVLTGAVGLHTRYVYTGKGSERSPYIAERARSMHNLTRDKVLQKSYTDRRGVCVPYQERDLRYDVAHGYLRQEGGDQVSKGSVLHRGPVGTRKRV